MFTGIIEATGQVQQIAQQGGDVKLTISSAHLDMRDVKLGDSIATNGICLTVIEMGTQWYSADVSLETLRRTTLNHWKAGTVVNLEKAMLPTTRFGGHIVSGHVDAVGEIVILKQDARSIYAEVTAPANIARYLAEKGSITVDGISLTVNHLNGHCICLNLVPHTAKHTNIGTWHVGQKLNLEVDLLARYIERLLQHSSTENAQNHNTSSSNVNLDLLAKSGFMR